LSLENLTASGDKLFFGANSYKYGYELYSGNANGKFSAVRLSDASSLEINPAAFDAVLYPNPTSNTSLLIIKGNQLTVDVSISDMLGRVIWSVSRNNDSQISLPVENFATGQYIVTVISGTNRKILKLVRE
jgi:hypothetical protein